MKLSIRKILDAVVFITPNFGDSETIRYKVKSTKIILWVLFYTFMVVFFNYLILRCNSFKKSSFSF